MKRKSLIALCCIASLLAGCASAEKRWQEAKTKNYVNAYKNFIHEYPDSPYAAEARQKIEQIEFENACKKGRIRDYQAFLKAYPQGRYASAATEKIAEIRLKKIKSDFQEAEKYPSVRSYQSFLKKHPDSPFEAQARAAIADIQKADAANLFKRAMERNSFMDFQKYCRQYPEGKDIAGAKQMLQKFSWQTINRDKLLTWKQLDLPGLLDKTAFTEKMRQSSGGLSFMAFTQGQNIYRMGEILFIRNDATEKAVHGRPYTFHISPLSEDSFMVSSAPEGYMLIGNFNLIVPRGSKMIIRQAAKEATGDAPADATKSSRIVPVGNISGSVFPTHQGGRTMAGVNICGHVCRKGAITVTEKGLLLAAGTELLADKL